VFDQNLIKLLVVTSNLQENGDSGTNEMTLEETIRQIQNVKNSSDPTS
jgi:hypothetical protein